MDRPVPIPFALDQEFWDAAKAGKLLLQRCVASGKFQWFPRAHSIHVPGGDVEWVESEGRGEIETFSVCHRSFYPDIPVPYVLAIVKLDEGIKLTGHVVDIQAEDVHIGMPVRVVFRPVSDEINVPCFAPS